MTRFFTKGDNIASGKAKEKKNEVGRMRSRILLKTEDVPVNNTNKTKCTLAGAPSLLSLNHAAVGKSRRCVKHGFKILEFVAEDIVQILF